jgi:hypothetical protein
MNRSRFLIHSVVLAVALLLAAPALASFKSGRYRGTTEQGKAISFKATRGQVSRMRFTTIALCESGHGSRGRFANLHARIRHSRFEIRLTADRGATTIVVKGRLTGPYAGGTIVDRTRVDPEREGAPDPKGTDRCKATVHWAAETG